MQRLHFESPHLSKCKICWICKKALSRKLVKSILLILALFQKSAVSKKRVWLSKKAFLTYFYKMKVQWEQDRLATLKNVWKGAKEILALNSIALYFAIFHFSRENECACKSHIIFHIPVAIDTAKFSGWFFMWNVLKFTIWKQTTTISNLDLFTSKQMLSLINAINLKCDTAHMIYSTQTFAGPNHLSMMYVNDFHI